MDGFGIQSDIRNVDVPRPKQHTVGKLPWPFPVVDGVRTEDSVRLMQAKHVKIAPDLNDIEDAPL
jgi:hypothetical protein